MRPGNKFVNIMRLENNITDKTAIKLMDMSTYMCQQTWRNLLISNLILCHYCSDSISAHLLQSHPWAIFGLSTHFFSIGHVTSLRNMGSPYHDYGNYQMGRLLHEYCCMAWIKHIPCTRRSVGISNKGKFNTAKMTHFILFWHGMNLDLTCIRLLW